MADDIKKETKKNEEPLEIPIEEEPKKEEDPVMSRFGKEKNDKHMTNNINPHGPILVQSKIEFIEESLDAIPVAGRIEFSDNKFYITNVATQRVVDRTSDVAVTTTTVANTATETTLWTGTMPANSVVTGNVFKFHADGLVSNNGNHSDNDFTLRVRVGGTEAASLTPATKALTDAHWHIDANATQRAIGASGKRAIHLHLEVDETDEEVLMSIADIDTTANMDVTVTVEWATANAANTISLYQGFMEYKN